MNEIVILGAGSSVDAGVPDANSMTRAILESFKSSSVQGRYYHVLCFTVGGLLFQRGVNRQDPFEGANIEDVFNAIQLLADRLELEAAPFIGSWHPLIEELDVIRLRRTQTRNTFEQMYRRSAGDRLSRELERMMKGESPSDRIGDIVTEMIQGGHSSSLTRTRDDKPTEQPGKGRLFRETNEYMIRKLISLTWIKETKRTQYLVPLVRAAKQRRIPIATLNYDNTVELAATSSGISADTGIASLSEKGRYSPETDRLVLLKLHGSIDWRFEDREQNDEHPLPSTVIRSASSKQIEEAGYRPAVIFGHRNKLTAEGPFLDILRAFQESLANADHATIVGYSFRDPHINEYIRQWINGERKRTVTVITTTGFASVASPFAKQLLALKPRVALVETGAARGISDVFNQKTEQKG